MGLLTNGFRDSIGVFQFYGAGTVNGGYPSTLVANFSRTGRNRNFAAGEGIADGTVGRPYGYRNPGAWIMPQKAGALSAHYLLLGDGDLTAAIAGGKNAEATLTGSGDLSAVGALIVSLVASLTGSGTVSGAALLAYLNLAATLAGSGDLEGAATALGHAAALLEGEGTVAGTSAATALGELIASITVTGTGLTTSNVGAAVWSAIAAANNDPGTMGEKLNDAGAAANPWTEVLESGMTAAEILRVILAGVAGDCTVTDAGGGSYTITFKSVDGAIDRITGTTTSGGVRSGSALDGSV